MLEPTDFNFQNAVYYYTNYETKDWRKVLELGNNTNLDLNERRRLSWVWPTVENFNQLKVILKTLKIRTILSIGCGCGLFEWILRESIGVSIFGLECDRQWWQSSHAVKSFIKHSYIEDLKPNCQPETFLQSCCDIHDKKNWKFAVMFCYFNNRSAFLNYLEMYKGQWIILIGPICEIGIHTDPTPLEPHFPTETQWKLCEQISIGTQDILAIYKNNKSDENTNEIVAKI